MSTVKKLACLVTLSSLIFGAVVTSSNIASGNQTIGWDTTATENRGRLDEDFSYNCPSNGRITNVWGTDIYTDDSSICSAAVHAGLIKPKTGGNVLIRIKPGQSSYQGSNRNDVSSQDYGSWDGSFTFLNGTVAVDSPHTVSPTSPLKWNADATQYRGRLNQDFSYKCPPNGHISQVWGTHTYTDDSSICSAAVHAGLITAKQGGNITIRIKPGRSSYVGTTHNGVNSQDFGRWDGSFIFIKR